MGREASSYEVAGLTWDRVGERLAAGTRAVLPIGAGAKEHGLHMPMATDWVFADYFARVLAENTDALIWPTLTYGTYPAFVAYAGSISLNDQTSRRSSPKSPTPSSTPARSPSSFSIPGLARSLQSMRRSGHRATPRVSAT